MSGSKKKNSSLGWFSLRRKTKRKFSSVSDQKEIKFKLEPVIGDKVLSPLRQEKILVASQEFGLIPITYKIMAEIIQAYKHSDGSETDLLRVVKLSDKLTFNLISPSGLHKLEYESFYKKSLEELFAPLNMSQIREIANCFSKGTVVKDLANLLPGMILDFQELQAFLLRIEKKIYDILGSEHDDFRNKSIIQAEQKIVSNEIIKIEKLIGSDEKDLAPEVSSNSFMHYYEELPFSLGQDNDLTCSEDFGYISADTLKNETNSAMRKTSTEFSFLKRDNESSSVEDSSVGIYSDDTYMAMNGKKP